MEEVELHKIGRPKVVIVPELLKDEVKIVKIASLKPFLKQQGAAIVRYMCSQAQLLKADEAAVRECKDEIEMGYMRSQCYVVLKEMGVLSKFKIIKHGLTLIIIKQIRSD